MSQAFHNEEDIRVIYEAAEFAVTRLVAQNVILVVDERQPAKRNTIRKVARSVADAVIRNANVIESGDITDVPGVNVENVRG